MSKKNELTFQQKFKDRMENMGKDGIHGLAKDLSTADRKQEESKQKGKCSLN
jgi:hypothetical protein